LQHEALHGHPTRSPALNEALVALPLTLLIPYRRYRVLHLSHHANENITDPILDPESFYLTPAAWQRLSALMRWLLTVNNTLAGRLVVGPPLWAVRFVVGEAGAALAGVPGVRRAWAQHLLAAAPVVVWASWVCGMPLWLYGLGVVWPAFSLSMLRTFAEHRAHERVEARTLIVDDAPILGFLFLNNNLHHLHHQRPGVPWYRLPGLYRAERLRLLAENGDYRYGGYLDLALQFLLRPKEPVAHPLINRDPQLARPSSP
jgi:fatty acid desaturase